MNEVNFTVDQAALAIIENTPITANFDEVKAALTEMVAPYKTMIVDGESIAAAKADRAKIRKVSARVEEVRKAIKTQYMRPYTEFESRCKELVAICNDGSENLDKQIKMIERLEADAKIAKLRKEYSAIADEEIQHYLPWGAINNPKWENKGFTFDAALSEIADAINGTRSDLETIRSMGGDDAPYLLDVYRQTRDLSAVIRKASELKTVRQREEQRARDEAWQRQEDARRKAERDRREAEERERIATSPQAAPRNDDVSIGERIATDAQRPRNDAEESVDLYCVTFRVSCSKQQLMALGQYMKENGIRYEKA